MEDKTLKTPESEMVQVKRQDLDGVIQELKDLRKRVETGAGVTKMSKVKERIATIMIIDGKPVVKIGDAKLVNKGTDDEKIIIEYWLEDDEKKHVADYLPFLQDTVRVKAAIIKQEEEEKEKVVISNYRPSNSNEHFNKKFKPDEVDMVVTSKEYTAEIEILEGELTGKKMRIENKYLNQ